MIYLTNGNMPLNAAYADEIVQENNSTYQLTFRFPTSDSLWEKLKEETFLKADDLHGEQDFVIFEVEKKHGYIQIYANQVFTLLNNYVVNPISLDRQTGSTALSRFAGSITRDNPFSFFSDIEDRHTFNIGYKNAMEAFAKDKHSIIGQWGGDLVRHGYQVHLLKNGGSENESLFMYKKNLSSYRHKNSTKSLKTRITFMTTVKGDGKKAPDRKFSVVVDSPLINKYSQIYEDVIEVNDQDVKDEASLRKYGEQYYRTSLCDMMEDSLELQVVGQSDVPVQMFDIVSLFHDVYNLDVRKKITKYTYSPMGKKLKTIGFGQFKSGLANVIGSAVSDAVKGETQQLQSDFERQLAREIKNADLAFDKKKEELVNQFTDGINAARARAEEVKREISDTINQRFDSFDNASIQEAKRKAEEALRNAGASSLLAQEAKRIGLDSVAKLEEFKRQAKSSQTALSGDLDALKRTVTSEVNQASEHRRTTTEALSRMTGQMNGFATKSEVRQDVTGLTETFAKLKTDTNNLISGAKSEITLAKTEFKKTADGLSAKMSAVESYVGQDSQRQEALRRYTREESARQVSAIREQISRDYVGKSTYQEDVRGLERRFSAISTQTNNDIATKIAQYKQTVDGQFSSITSQIAGKVNQTDFQRVRETSQLYERIIGSNENDISNKVARMALTNQLFQVEVSKNEGMKTIQRQLAGSWAVRNINSAGDLISGLNLGANGHNRLSGKLTHITGETLIERAVIKSAMVDKLKTANFEAGSVTTVVLDAEAVTADKVRMDQAFANKLVASNIFTDTLAAKQAFINKLRSVVVTATLLEGYKGKIGGFQIGTHDKDPSAYWLTGMNQFAVGMSNGSGRWNQTALWVNWGNNWESPSNTAWFVKHTGQMYCYNRAEFWNTPIIHGDLEVTGNIYYITDRKTGKGGYWIHSPKYSRLEPSNNYLYLYYSGSGYDWIPMNKEISDRRYKTNIKDSTVSGLDVINSLKTYSYRKEYDGKTTDISCGIMAQDVQKYVPEAFFENPDGAYSYRTFELVPYLIKAIQELNQKLEKLA